MSFGRSPQDEEQGQGQTATAGASVSGPSFKPASKDPGQDEAYHNMVADDENFKKSSRSEILKEKLRQAGRGITWFANGAKYYIDKALEQVAPAMLHPYTASYLVISAMDQTPSPTHDHSTFNGWWDVNMPVFVAGAFFMMPTMLAARYNPAPGTPIPTGVLGRTYDAVSSVVIGGLNAVGMQFTMGDRVASAATNSTDHHMVAAARTGAVGAKMGIDKLVARRWPSLFTRSTSRVEAPAPDLSINGPGNRR